MGAPPRPGAAAWLRRNLFASWAQGLMTLAGAAFVAWTAGGLLRWAVWQARLGSGPESCAGVEGACWSFVADNYALFLVGTYPAAERWRPAAALGLVAAFAAAMAVPRIRAWRPARWTWIPAAAVVFVLLRGHPALGLRPVDTAAWGGLLLTAILSTVGIAASFPLGILLALGRRSRRMPAVRGLCVAYIELLRSVPLVSILFLAAVLVPLFLPQGMTVDNLLRAQVGIVLFQAAYLAEVVRGGLQAVPPGQAEAAISLGLGPLQSVRLVILPQALRLVIPALVNQFIIIVKDTSLVVVVGMFDLLGIAEVTVRNAVWRGRIFEAYAFVGAVYWTLCFAISRLSLRLERRTAAMGA